MSKTDGWVVTRTDTEKLYEVFLARYRGFWEAGSGMRERDVVDMWEDWLRDLKGVDYIRKFSNIAESIDYLLEEVNKPGWDRLVIRDPSDNKKFIIVERGLAEKALVLGSLP